MTVSENRFLETADDLAIKICRDALWASNRCNWLGPSMEYVDKAWTVVNRAYGPDLYSGTSGIAFFLAHAYRENQDKIYRMTAEGALRQALSTANNIPAETRCGFYSGVAGIAYAMLEAAEIFSDEQYALDGLQLLESLANDDPSNQALDVISGSAGAIVALLHCFGKQKQKFLIELAVKHGEHLLSTAHQTSDGWSWNTLNTEPHLTGFSHGAAGIGWALLELFHATKDPRFRQGADGAFAYERRWYNAEQENWPDFRSFATQDPTAVSYAFAWCHGAPGIGLSRLRAFELTGDEVHRHEAEAAIRTTSKTLSAGLQSWQDNFSLCHGLAGNADLLLCAEQVLRDDSHRPLLESIAEAGTERHRKPNLPWPCGVPQGGETPNLMLGFAGIGYFYLRLHNAAAHPSILLIPSTARSKTAKKLR